MHRSVILAGIAAGSVAAGGLATAGGAARPRTFSVIEQDLAQARTDAANHPTVLAGDVIATTFTLYRGSKKVGRAQNACIAVPGPAGTAQCTQTFFFTRGQIVVTRARFPQPHADPAVVLGGTGAYRGVRGNATFAGTKSPIRYRVTFALER